MWHPLAFRCPAKYAYWVPNSGLHGFRISQLGQGTFVRNSG